MSTTTRNNPLNSTTPTTSVSSSSTSNPTIGNLVVRTGGGNTSLSSSSSSSSSTVARSLKILTCTWNAGNARPPTNLDPWIPSKGGNYDIIVVGFQECTFKEKKKKESSHNNSNNNNSSSNLSSSPSVPSSPSRTNGNGNGSDNEDDDEYRDDDDNEHAPPKADEDVDLAALERQITGQAFKSSSSTGTAASSSSSSLEGTVITKEEEEAMEQRKHFPTAVARVVMAEAAARNKAEAEAKGSSTSSKVKPAIVNTCAAFENVKNFIGEQFTLVSSILMWQIGIMVFSRKGIPVDDVETGTEATGLMGITPNKGGVVVKLRVYNTTRLVFAVSHLAAHMKHVSHRNLNAIEIMDNIRFGNTLLDFDSQYHHCFWMGDLNYRIDLGLTKGGELNIDNKDRFAEVQEYVTKKDYASLLAADQLRHAMKQGLVFAGFRESDPFFQPTFKVRRSPDFVYNPQRVSSWCDRVLWKSLPAYKDDVKPLSYAAHPSVTTSDHKPVHASFEISVRPVPPIIPFPVDAPTESLRGPIVKITNLKGHNLLGMDVSGKSDVYCLFYSDRALRGPRANKPPKTATIRQTIDPVWGDEHIDSMRISASNANDLAYAHLLIVVMDKDVDADDRMGQAVLSLQEAANPSRGTVPFDVPVTKAGRQYGTLTGSIEVIWPSGNAQRDTVRSRQRTGISCCTIM